MAFAKLLKKFRAEPDLEKHLRHKSQVRTEVYRTSFQRQTEMNKSDSAAMNTSSEVQNPHPQKGSTLTLAEVLALEAT